MPHATGIHWFDNHCHLDLHTQGLNEAAWDSPEVFAAAIQQAQEFVLEARSHGVIGLNLVGVDGPTSRLYQRVASQVGGVWSTAGVHPHEARRGLADLKSVLAEHHNSGQIVAVGECGLDYYYNHSDRDSQRSAFAAQIDLAHEYGLPLVIHTRDAWDETFEILDAQGVPEHTVFHCFTGGPAEAEAALSRNAYLSVSGIVTFKTATDVQAAVQQTPLTSLMVETDSPYLAPVPHRGKPNRPVNVSHVGIKVAELLEQDVSEVARVTTHNAATFYRLDINNVERDGTESGGLT